MIWSTSWGQGLGQAMGGTGNALGQLSSTNANQLGMANAASSYSAQQQYGQWQARPVHHWMIDGVGYDFNDFVDEIFPEDSAEKTAFLLKWSK
jgi:hypothetical protein